MKITASMSKALETLAEIIEGKTRIDQTSASLQKPFWGWKDAKSMVLSEIMSEPELIEEPNGHGGTVMSPTGNCIRRRKVSFWMTNEFHLATIYLKNKDNDQERQEWEVEHVETGVDPQYGCCGRTIHNIVAWK